MYHFFLKNHKSHNLLQINSTSEQPNFRQSWEIWHRLDSKYTTLPGILRIYHRAYPKSHFILNRWEFSKLFLWSWAWLIIRNTRPKKQISSFGMSSFFSSFSEVNTTLQLPNMIF